MTATERDRTAERSIEVTPELCEILQASLEALAEAGEADAACRLAGRACAVLRERGPLQWNRFNKVLHRLSPRTDPVGSFPPAP